MSKYIVDIDDFEPHFKVDSIGVFGIGKSLSYSEEDHSWSRIKSIEEFEELNSDYINENFGELQDEAYKQGYAEAERIWRAPSSDNEFYQKGLEDGKKAFDLLDAERNSEYQRGLDDAWDAAREIAVNMDVHERARVFSQDAEAVTHEELFKSYSAQEAIEKIKAYENKKIHVGDFVSYNDVPEIIMLVTYVGLDDFIGVAVTDVEDRCRKGEAYTYYNSGNWHKIDIQLVKGES